MNKLLSQKTQPKQTGDSSGQVFVDLEDVMNLRRKSYIRTLNKVRQQLSVWERAVSRLVHLPAVDYVSELGEHTIARPSGLIGGGLLLFLGSLFMLYTSLTGDNQFAKPNLFIIFITGFFIGIIIELFLNLKRR